MLTKHITYTKTYHFACRSEGYIFGLSTIYCMPVRFGHYFQFIHEEILPAGLCSSPRGILNLLAASLNYRLLEPSQSSYICTEIRLVSGEPYLVIRSTINQYTSLIDRQLRKVPYFLSLGGSTVSKLCLQNFCQNLL